MDSPENACYGEESPETSGSPQDQRKGLILASLGMMLVRSSLAGDTVHRPHLGFILAYSRTYYANEDYYLINFN